MALADTARLAVQIDLEGNAAAGVAKLNRQVQGLSRSVGRAGRGVGQVGAGLARAGLFVGGAAVAGLTAAAKAGIDFEDAFAGVRKTVNEADLKGAGLSFEALAKSFREMATEMPLSAVQFAELGETAGALGIKAKDIKEFTRVTALMGVTTNLTANEAADAFGRIGTILGLTGDDFEELADTIVNLGNAGASTESEITEIVKRFAAEAKSAGLAKEEIAALASATASLGFQPERGGTALARVFANMATNISLANSKGKALGKGLGRSVKDLQRDIDRGKGLGIFMDVLKEIRGMSPTAANRFLKSIGVTNTSDRTIFRTMSQQLPFVNEQLEIARKSTGALTKEAEKKFATTASKIQIFKNNLIESGIAMSEQFLPAVGRALDKLTAAFKDPTTKGEIVQLGKDIGAAIDDIDWDEVLRNAKDFVGVLKGALGFTLRILDAINKLPAELKGAAAGFLLLNKLSGGLVGAGVGNVVGGLAGAATQGLASRAPGIGKLFAQPVFVTNWPAGGLGGGAPAAAGGGGSGLIGKAIALSVAGAIVVAAVPIGKAFAAALPPALKGPGGKGESESQRRITEARDAINKRIPEATTAINRMKQSTNEKVIGTTNSINRMKEAAGIQSRTETATVRTTAMGIQTTTRAASMSNASVVANATRSSGASIVAAIYAARPVVNVTNVTRSTTIQNRYGPSNGSAGQDHGGSIGFGGGG